MAESTARIEVASDGAPFLLEVSVPTGGMEEDVSALTEALRFEDLAESISTVAQTMTDALRRVRPDEAEVTFGVDATLETGKLTSLVVKGSGTATFQIRLLWKSDGADQDG